MKSESNALSVLLYRKVLRYMKAVTVLHYERVAFDRWAEYIPRGVEVHVKDTPQTICRRIFEARRPPGKSNSDAVFGFLRSAHSDMQDFHILSLWEREVKKGSFDLLDGLCILSSALFLPKVALCASKIQAPPQTETTHTLENLKGWIQRAIKVPLPPFPSNVTASSAITKASTRSCHEFYVTVLSRVTQHTGFSRQETSPLDYSLVNLEKQGRASEYVLNILLQSILEKNGLPAEMVGFTDYPFPLVKVPSGGEKGSPFYISWSYGVLSKGEVEQAIGRCHNGHWYRSTNPWGASLRRTILCDLLRKQLSLASHPASTAAGSESGDSAATLSRYRSHICREQLMFLL